MLATKIYSQILTGNCKIASLNTFLPREALRYGFPPVCIYIEKCNLLRLVNLGNVKKPGDILFCIIETEGCFQRWHPVIVFNSSNNNQNLVLMGFREALKIVLNLAFLGMIKPLWTWAGPGLDCKKIYNKMLYIKEKFLLGVGRCWWFT